MCVKLQYIKSIKNQRELNIKLQPNLQRPKEKKKRKIPHPRYIFF
jgi:hypothetical protein